MSGPVIMTEKDPRGASAPPQQVAIRPLRREDREQLLDILRATKVFSPEEIAVALELIDAVLDRPDQRDYIIFVSEGGGAAQGYYCVGPTPATASTYDLYWIAVAPGLHGRGMGTALNEHAEALIRSRGGKLIMVETSSRAEYDPTRAFYRRRGYQELARVRDYYRPADDLVMFGKYFS
jgi:ribosomal protein S18 acetylase RimI-like enzyme